MQQQIQQLEAAADALGKANMLNAQDKAREFAQATLATVREVATQLGALKQRCEGRAHG